MTELLGRHMFEPSKI